jgi:hypothetical protein
VRRGCLSLRSTHAAHRWGRVTTGKLHPLLRNSVQLSRGSEGHGHRSMRTCLLSPALVTQTISAPPPAVACTRRVTGHVCQTSSGAARRPSCSAVTCLHEGWTTRTSAWSSRQASAVDGAGVWLLAPFLVLAALPAWAGTSEQGSACHCYCYAGILHT